ncbi:hypothetical protein KUTeg_004725 [Tegillarca granosa]|uniref:Uncharacterized protein n=1 Tax=Tegillarca granosa TaxID=220873 RepID=A0ABQ9FHN0_TEGGR|nr:hypothetical protein KUTeg_004725 [Tegillarca granosa]
MPTLTCDIFQIKQAIKNYHIRESSVQIYSMSPIHESNPRVQSSPRVQVMSPVQESNPIQESNPVHILHFAANYEIFIPETRTCFFHFHKSKSIGYFRMETSRVLVEEIDFSAPSFCPKDERCNDMFMEFIYIVVIPGGLVLILALLLSIIMCCSGTKRIQMDRYLSLRRASHSLRELSRKRDTPLIDHSGMGGSLQTLERDRFRRGAQGRDRCQSAPGTLQRDRRRYHREATTPPPGYHLPPDYSSLSGRNGTVNRPGSLTASAYQEDSSDQDTLLTPQ